MNPLNLQLCNIPLPSQLIDTPQQETSPKRGHLFNSPIDSILSMLLAPGLECAATEQLPAAPAHPYHYPIYEKESKPKLSSNSHLFLLPR